MTDREETTLRREEQKKGPNWRFLIGILISAVFLYFAIRDLKPATVWDAFRQAQYVWIVPAVALYLSALISRTARWRVILSSERKISLRRLLPTMAIGRGANNIYPLRAGEVVRVLLLRRRNNVSAAAGLASILVERTFDGLTMLLFLILAAFIGGIPPFLRGAVALAAIVFGAALAVIYAIVLWPAVVERVAEWTIEHLTPDRFHERLLGVAERFIGGFASVRSPLKLTGVLFFSLLVWGAETFSYRLLMNSFGFQVGLHYLLLMSGAANLGTALPSGPGNLGTFDTPSILVLTQVGIEKGIATSYQALLHAVLWTTETLAGLWFMWRVGLQRADLKDTLEDTEPAKEAALAGGESQAESV